MPKSVVITGLSGEWLFSFVRNSQIVFQSSYTILHSLRWCKREAVSLHPRQHLVVSVFSSLAHSNRCVGVSHCGFNLLFPNGKWCWTAFHVFISHPYLLLGKISTSFTRSLIGFVVVVVFLLSFVSSLYWVGQKVQKSYRKNPNELFGQPDM